MLNRGCFKKTLTKKSPIWAHLEGHGCPGVVLGVLCRDGGLNGTGGGLQEQAEKRRSDPVT